MKTNIKLVWFAGSALICLLNGCVSPNYNSGSSDSTNQQIEQDSQQIMQMRLSLAKEFPTYSPDYTKRVVQILGICQKAMESPRLMMGSIHADASSQLDSLKLDFPQLRIPVATKELEIIIDKIGALDKLGEPDEYPPGRYLAVAKPLTDYVINAIKTMRDVLVNHSQSIFQ